MTIHVTPVFQMGLHKDDNMPEMAILCKTSVLKGSHSHYYLCNGKHNPTTWYDSCSNAVACLFGYIYIYCIYIYIYMCIYYGWVCLAPKLLINMNLELGRVS